MVVSTLTTTDYEALAMWLAVPVPNVKSGLDSRQNMSTFNISQLKQIIKFLRERKGAKVNLTGTKNVLIDGIARVLWEDGNNNKAPTIPHARQAQPHVPHAQGAGHVTIEHNTTWQPQQWTPPKQPYHLTFNDENFFAKQVPFFEHVSLLAVIPFNAREDMHPRNSFQIDDATLALVREKKKAVHARFFSKERRGDIPWNIDVVLKINSTVIDIQKLARKIRSKAYKDPYILPRPADVSHTLRQATNSIEFCHPGETGFLVLHVVQERDINSLISHVVNNCKVTAASRTQMKNDDIEEMNYILSMKCPLSCMRIENPVRSKLCNHEQCFDLRSFMDYCYQQQLWHCPVCEIGAPYKDLVYDDNFKAISTTTTADKVTVSPDGTITDADAEPSAKRQKLSTPSTPSAASPTAATVTSPPPTPNPPPPPASIMLVDDSPPPSPTQAPPRRVEAPPFPFAPPPGVEIPPVTTTTTTTTSSDLATPTPAQPSTPSLPTPMQLSTPLHDSPPSTGTTNASANDTPIQSPAQTNSSPPSMQEASPPHSSSQPKIIDVKQDPGFFTKMISFGAKKIGFSPSSTPTATTTPPQPLPPPSPTTATTPTPPTPPPATPPNNTTTTTSSSSAPNGKLASPNGNGHLGNNIGNTSTDAIVISDSED